MQTIRDAKIKGKTVLVRTDYNVPLKDGKVAEDLRIRASLETLEYLREAGAKKIVVISHLGRPEGKDASLSLRPVFEALKEMLPKVYFVDDVSGPDVEAAVEELPEGGILLLQNLRFFKGEEANSAEFMREIVDAVGADLYVQDGFAVLHRAHASTAAVAEFLPVYAGLLVEREVKNLTKVMKEPKRPLVLVIGGAKVEDKAPLIEKFGKIADTILVGGKIAADGYARPSGMKAEVYVAEDFDEDAAGVKLDVGPVATTEIAKRLEGAGTVIWNGLLGKAEDPAYATASTIVATLIGEKPETETVILGGDTTGFVEELMKEKPELNYTLVSTGGGAALEFLLGKTLPGLESIQE